jgi:hypothetical protein
MGKMILKKTEFSSKIKIKNKKEYKKNNNLKSELWDIVQYE